MTLEELMEVARDIVESQTDEERSAMHKRQRVSFAYGNVALANPHVTRELVERIAAAEKAGEGKP